MLEATGITKAYGDVQALAGADLSVDAGQIVSLLGRNGAGKTTLLSIIAGLIRPDAGHVFIGGVDAAADPDATARLTGIAPQETGIYPVLTVRENLDFFAELNGISKGDRRRRVNETADQLGLGELVDRRASNLSGGEARRLHTACALLHRPRLLMLDEPTVGADVTTRAQLIDAVRALARDGAAVIYTTHYMPEVETLAADIVIIDRGLILGTGSQAELIDQHRVEGLEFVLSEPADRGARQASLEALGAVDVGDGLFRVHRSMPIGALVAALGSEADRLVSVKTLSPDLESVFLTVTGRSLDEAATESSDSSSATEASA